MEPVADSVNYDRAAARLRASNTQCEPDASSKQRQNVKYGGRVLGGGGSTLDRGRVAFGVSEEGVALRVCVRTILSDGSIDRNVPAGG
jgi:hypothetical protein